MCYTILVIEKYCKRKHIQAAKLCWRQCKTQAALSFETNNWRQLCEHCERTDQEHEAWYPFTSQASDPICDVCLCLETDHEVREIRTVLDPTDIFVKDCQSALVEQVETQDKLEGELILDSPKMTDSVRYQLAQEYVVLFKTQRFLQNNINRKLEQVKWCQDRYDEIERRYESIYCDPILDRAVTLFERRVLVYMGRPDETELENLDCPRHLLRCDSMKCEILVC